MASFLFIIVRIVADLVAWVGLAVRPRKSLEAEILFLRRQLAQYVERGVKPRRIDPVTRVRLALLSQLCDWRGCFGGGSSRDPDPLAPCGMEIILAAQVSTRPTADLSERSSNH